jgi:sulfate permease, SulP family
MLKQAVAELRQRNTEAALARLESDRAQRAAARTGLIGVIGSGKVFRSVEDAIRARS